MAKKTIEQLKKEMKMLEEEEAKARAKKEKEDERKALEKKIKKIKFQKTGLGKVTKVVGEGVNIITRPELKDKKGNVTQEGGLASKVGKKLFAVGNQLTKPKPKAQIQVRPQVRPQPLIRETPPRQVIQEVSPQPAKPQKSFSEIMANVTNMANFGNTMTPPPQNRGKKKKPAQSKPMDVNALLRSLPQ